jgi:hypothetical protein
MWRPFVLILAFLLLPSLVLFFSGYGIRVKAKPCTYFIGIGTMANYLRHDCPQFGKAYWAIP